MWWVDLWDANLTDNWVFCCCRGEWDLLHAWSDFGQQRSQAEHSSSPACSLCTRRWGAKLYAFHWLFYTKYMAVWYNLLCNYTGSALWCTVWYKIVLGMFSCFYTCLAVILIRPNYFLKSYSITHFNIGLLLIESSMTENFEFRRLKKMRVRQICCRRLSGFTKHFKVLRNLVEL